MFRLQIADSQTEIRTHKRFDDADDLSVVLLGRVDDPLKLVKKIFRITQRRDLHNLDLCFGIECLCDEVGIFIGLKIGTPVIENLVEMLEVFIEKTSGRRL